MVTTNRAVEQANTAKILKEFVDSDLANLGLTIMHVLFSINLEAMKSAKVDGKFATEYREYEAVYNLFYELKSKSTDFSNAFSLFGIDKDELANKMRNKEISKKDLLNILISKIMTPELNEKLASVVSFSNEESERIIRSLKDHDVVLNEMDSKGLSDDFQKYVLLKLYNDFYESYVKVLFEYYQKLEKADLSKMPYLKSAGIVSTYFKERYPILYEGMNAKLRLDAAHATYNERDKFTTQQVRELLRVLVVKILAAMRAGFDYLESVFSKDIETFINFENQESK